MTLSESDVEEFIVLLQDDPRLRDRVRNAILADDFLALPGLVRQLSEDMIHLRASVSTLVEESARQRGDIQSLVQESARQRGDIQALTAVVATIGDDLKLLGTEVKALGAEVKALGVEVTALAVEARSQRGDLGRINGRLYEFEYERRLGGRIGKHFSFERDSHVSQYPPVVEAYIDGRLSESEWDDLNLADITVIGKPRRQQDAPESVIVIELSIVVDTDDVVRALRRAEIVRKLGIPAIPCVDGEVITPQAVWMAKADGVMALVRKPTFP